MNDNDLMTAVREPFAAVRMDVPVDTVVRRGRTLRRRKRLPALAGVAAAAAAAVAVLTTVPGARPAPPRVPAHLAAWTVTRNTDGTLTIVVNELKNAAGLQARLRADGVPARVAFDSSNDVSPALPKGCVAPRMSDEANAKLQDKIIRPPVFTGSSVGHSSGNYPMLRLVPSAIPPGIGLYLGVSMSPSNAYIGVDLVRATPRCTGS